MEKDLLPEALVERFVEIAELGLPDDPLDQILSARYVCSDIGEVWYPVTYHHRAGMLLGFREKDNQLVFGIFMIGMLLRNQKPKFLLADIDGLFSSDIKRDSSFIECRIRDLGLPINSKAAKGRYNIKSQLSLVGKNEPHFITIDSRGLS